MQEGQPPDRRKWWVLLAVGVCSFMTALDGSSVNTVLPVAARDLHAEIDSVQWVITIFLLVVSGLMLSFGRLGDLRGHKKVFLSGFALAIGAAAFNGFAPTVTALVIGRAIQGLGSAAIYANSAAILTHNFPAEQRGQALGMQASLTYAGLTVGPSLGGWLAQWLSWRAVFFVDVPVGLAAWFVSLTLIPPDKPSGVREKFDGPGAVAYMTGLSALLLAMNKGHQWGWGSALVIGLLVGAAAALALFVVREGRTPAPMLDLTLFHGRTFSMSTVSALLDYVCVYTTVFLLPFYLIQARGLNPARAGLILSAQPLVMIVAAPVSGILSDRMDGRFLSALGMVIFAAGLVGLARLDGASPLWHTVGALVLTGLGTGTFIAPDNSALMGAAPRGRQGIAAGILATARNTGMMLGVGLSGAIFTTVLARAQAGADPAAIAGARYSAISVSFAVVAGVALAGAVTSALAGRAR